MKKVPIALLVLALAFCAALASAQQQGQLEVSPGEQAAIRVAHLSPDAADIDISVNGMSAFQGVGYRDVTSYQAVPSGSVEVSITAGGAQEPLISATLEVEAGIYYTIAALGPEEALEARVYRDNLRAFPPSNGASIRVLHASQAAGAVDVAVRDGDILVQNLDFGQVSEYFFVPAGTYNLDVREAGTENVAFGIDNLEVRPGYVYTHFVIGGPEGEQVTQQDQVQETAEPEQPAEDEPAETEEPTTAEPTAAEEPADPEATPEEEQEPTGQEDTQQVQTTPLETPETDQEADQQTDQQQTQQQQAEPAGTEETPEEEEEEPTGQENSWLVQADAPVMLHINQQTTQQTQQQQTELQPAPQAAQQEAGLGALTVNVDFAGEDRLQLDIFGPGDYHETFLAEPQQTIGNLQPGTYVVMVNVPGWTEEQEDETRAGTEVEVGAGEVETVTVAPQPQTEQAQATQQQAAQPAGQQAAQPATATQPAAADAEQGNLTINVDHRDADQVELLVTGPDDYSETLMVDAGEEQQTLEGLQPGTYTVTVVEPRFEGENVELQAEVEVQAGETATVTVPVQPGAEPTTAATAETEAAPAEEEPVEEDAAATELEAGEGGLEILIEQAGVTVEVTGPGGYNQTVTQSQTLVDLAPGTYIVTTMGEGVQPRMQEVEVTGDEVVTVVIDEEMPVAEPTEEPEPVEEPEPTEEPEPVEEPEPTEEPEPVDEPEPAVAEAPAPGEFEVIIAVDARMLGTPEDEDQDQNQDQN